MNLRFTISRKIGIGFAVLILSTLTVFFLTYKTLYTGRTISDKINSVYNPSVFALAQLQSAVMRSRTLVGMWASVQSREDTKEKLSLIGIISTEIPEIKADIDSLALSWTPAEKRKKEVIYQNLDELLNMYREVQYTLVDMQSYDDPIARFSMSELVEEDGLIFKKSIEVLSQIKALSGEQRTNITQDSVVMLSAFDKLEDYLIGFGFGLFIAGVAIAFLTTRSIVQPVHRLKNILGILGEGRFPDKAIVDTGDEIGEMSLALKRLVVGLEGTAEFAYNIGEGHFDTVFKPLSNEDVLGKALLSMRDKLKINEQELERQVLDRTREVVKQKNKIEKQNEQRKELLENITASIVYAKRIQENILPADTVVRSLLPQSFVFYKPKDIVSGDFYFIRAYGSKTLIAAVDCTGHGVPGAFMSLVGHNALHQAIATNRDDLDPASILFDLSRFSAKTLNRTAHAGTQFGGRDGMDLALCVYDQKAETLDYAGAFNPLYHIRRGKLTSIKADKISIGSIEDASKKFTSHRIDLEPEDMMYIFSDGYVDQFGGVKGRKFMYAPFRKLLLDNWDKNAQDQKAELSRSMAKWRRAGTEVAEQVDDMLIIGFRHLGPDG